MATTFVLVANRAEACLFKATNPTGPLKEVEKLTHPQSRLHEQDLKADRPGRTFERVGDVRHAKEPPVSAKEHETLAFAEEISDCLDKACHEEPTAAVVLVAGPAFLGILRDKLSSSVRSMVPLELNKNIVKFDPEKIRAFLPERLSFPG